MLNKQDQNQTAGDGAVQTQVVGQNNSINVYNGISATDAIAIAKTVFGEQSKQALENFACIAAKTAEERIHHLESILLPRLEKIENGLSHFQDPKFQFMIRDAQISAAKTDSQDDWNLLSELLAHHVENNGNKMSDVAINEAIKVVGQIDVEALGILTILYGIGYFRPISGNISEGIKVMEDTLKTIFPRPFPKDSNCLEHLAVLNVIRISSLPIKKLENYLLNKYKDYVCVGVKKGSSEYFSVIKILDSYKIPHSDLVENECLDGYFRLNISSIENVSPQYVEPVSCVLDKYSNDKSLLKEAKINFMNIWDSFEYLKALRCWWDSMPFSYSITHVGKILAQINAKRLVPDIPDKRWF